MIDGESWLLFSYFFRNQVYERGSRQKGHEDLRLMLGEDQANERN
jgi:hypothetical protein